MRIRELSFFLLLWVSALPAGARPMVGVIGGSPNQLIRFDSATPATITSTINITGMVSGDVVRGIDFRPANGVLYALGINNTAGTDTGRIYTIDLATAVATQVGAAPFSTTLTDLSFYGFAFDPVADRIRIVNQADQNLRVDPDTGALAATDTNLDNTGAPGTEEVVGLAYDRSDRNSGTASTLFGIDFANDRFVRIGGVNGSPSPNLGAVTTINPLGINVSSRNVGFDIAEDGSAFASLSTGNGPVVFALYAIDLATGAATLVGNIGSGSVIISAVAAIPSAVANINSGKFFATIQAAINDAQTLSGHTIVVNAGTFSELVTVNKSLTLLGAKSGIDARAAGRGSLETVVRGGTSGTARTSGFRVTVDGVTIDGFTVQEANDANQFGAGIFLNANIAGTKIRNNIIQNNTKGLVVSNDNGTNPLIVERNLFANNNLPGPLSGTAIYTDQTNAGSVFTGVLIDNNTFESNQNAGVFLGSTLTGSQSNIAISNNVISNSGNGILIYNTVASFVTGNTITGSTGSQVVLGGGVSDVSLSQNIIDNGASRGVRIGDLGGGSANSNLIFGSNAIQNNSGAGLEISAGSGSYTGTLIAQNNWWGSSTGPTIITNPAGTGQNLVDPAIQVVFQPFLSSNVDYQATAPGFQCYPAPTLYAINSANNNLVRFPSSNPASVTAVAITGLVAGDTIIALDFRPATGELFGLGSGSRLYVINPVTGAATVRGSDGAFTLNGQSFGFDFNPIVDRIRVTSDAEQNLRLNPNDGTVNSIDPLLGYGSGDPGFGLDVDAGGTAYLNNFFGATRTTLYDIDTAQNVLARQGSFSATPVTANSGQLFTVGSLGIGINPTDDLTRANCAFDIFSPVAGVNLPLAAMTLDGTSSLLFKINLVTGSATFVDVIGGASPILVRALTAAPVGDFEFSAPTYSVSESGPVATITINRVRGSEGSATVQFTTSDGTAEGGADYTDSDQVVVFGSGVTSRTVQIPLNNDALDEFNETIFLALTNPVGGAFLGAQNTAVLTITDDDAATPTLTTQSSPSVALGEAVFNTASISGNGVAPPGGTLTFQLFGPNDNGCSGAPIFTSTVPVNGNGNYISGSFTPSAPGAYNWVVIYSGDAIHNAAVTTACGGPTQSITATATVLGNIATRLRVETGDNALIAGFIITGTQPKKVIVRGIGSSLALADKLADPTLELRDSTGALVDANDNWKSSPNKQAIIDSTIPPTDDAESAIVAILPANNSSYTAILRGANNTTGIGVVEAYDLDRLVDSKLANISTRGFVSTGDNILFAGTIVVGKNPQNVIVRAIGPSLGLTGKMADPTLELRDGNGALIDFNDNWVDSPNKQAIINSTVAPTDNNESAIVATLPGNNSNCTALVRGVNGTTGIAVVEVYALP
ncbi:MAG: hypothetical protein QOE26_2193 [Verrucomicrobiota bacterium]